LHGGCASTKKDESRALPEDTESTGWFISNDFIMSATPLHEKKEIKSLDRAKRVALLEGMNPTWGDLSEQWGKSLDFEAFASQVQKADPSLRS
jgi:hypothetical protein